MKQDIMSKTTMIRRRKRKQTNDNESISWIPSVDVVMILSIFLIIGSIINSIQKEDYNSKTFFVHALQSSSSRVSRVSPSSSSPLLPSERMQKNPVLFGFNDRSSRMTIGASSSSSSSSSPSSSSSSFTAKERKKMTSNISTKSTRTMKLPPLWQMSQPTIVTTSQEQERRKSGAGDRSSNLPFTFRQVPPVATSAGIVLALSIILVLGSSQDSTNLIDMAEDASSSMYNSAVSSTAIGSSSSNNIAIWDEFAKGTITNVFDATVPTSSTDFISVAIGESIAGIIGATLTAAFRARMFTSSSSSINNNNINEMYSVNTNDDIDVVDDGDNNKNKKQGTRTIDTMKNDYYRPSVPTTTPSMSTISTDALADSDYFLAQSATLPLLESIFGMNPGIASITSVLIASIPYQLIKLSNKRRQEYRIWEDTMMEQLLLEKEKNEKSNRRRKNDGQLQRQYRMVLNTFPVPSFVPANNDDDNKNNEENNKINDKSMQSSVDMKPTMNALSTMITTTRSTIEKAMMKNVRTGTGISIFNEDDINSSNAIKTTTTSSSLSSNNIADPTNNVVPVTQQQQEIDFIEIFSDITRWLSYSVLTDTFASSLLTIISSSTSTEIATTMTTSTSTAISMSMMMTMMQQRFIVGAVLGGLAACSAQLYADLLYGGFRCGPMNKQQEVLQRINKGNLDDLFNVYSSKLLSSATLFGVYESIQMPVTRYIQATLAGGVEGCFGSSNFDICIQTYIDTNSPGPTAEAQFRALATNLVMVGTRLQEIPGDTSLEDVQALIGAWVSSASSYLSQVW